MIDLSSVSDEDLQLEVSARLSQGRFGYAGLMSRVQMNAYANWCALHVYAWEMQNTDFERWSPLVRKMSEIAGTQSAPVVIRAINTTLIGRENEVS